MATVNRYTIYLSTLTTRTAVLDLIMSLAVDKTITNTEFALIYGVALNKMKALY